MDIIRRILDALDSLHPYTISRSKNHVRVNWDTYYHSRLLPIGPSWGKKDLLLYKRWYWTWVKAIQKVLDFDMRDKYAFEIGSGIGSATSLLAAKGLHIIGSDISREMIQTATYLEPNIPFIYFDVRKNTLKNNTFDLVFAFEVLEHISHPAQAIRTIKSLLHQGGVFIGTSPYPYPKNFEDPTHRVLYKPIYWKRLFMKQGFHRVDTYPMTFLPYIWRISKYANYPFPFYTTNATCVSTILIIAYV